jgi:predicted small metal-binding protein
MIKLSCKESGFECDYFVEGKTEAEVLERISEHAVKVHNMKEEDIYEEDISAAFVCHTIGKMTSIHNKQN